MHYDPEFLTCQRCRTQHHTQQELISHLQKCQVPHSTPIPDGNFVESYFLMPFYELNHSYTVHTTSGALEVVDEMSKPIKKSRGDWSAAPVHDHLDAKRCKLEGKKVLESQSSHLRPFSCYALASLNSVQ
jgi:hypothetical protein